jgi:hypothetical protein
MEKVESRLPRKPVGILWLPDEVPLAIERSTNQACPYEYESVPPKYVEFLGTVNAPCPLEAIPPNVLFSEYPNGKETWPWPNKRSPEAETSFFVDLGACNIGGGAIKSVVAVAGCSVAGAGATCVAVSAGGGGGTAAGGGGDAGAADGGAAVGTGSGGGAVTIGTVAAGGATVAGGGV